MRPSEEQASWAGLLWLRAETGRRPAPVPSRSRRKDETTGLPAQCVQPGPRGPGLPPSLLRRPFAATLLEEAMRPGQSVLAESAGRPGQSELSELSETVRTVKTVKTDENRREQSRLPEEPGHGPRGLTLSELSQTARLFVTFLLFSSLSAGPCSWPPVSALF